MKWWMKVWALVVALAALLMCLQDFFNANEVTPKEAEYEVSE